MNARRFEVLPSGGWAACPFESMPDRWCVQASDDASNFIKHVPYAVACAIARHLNGHNPEAGDMEALVTFSAHRGKTL